MKKIKKEEPATEVKQITEEEENLLVAQNIFEGKLIKLYDKKANLEAEIQSYSIALEQLNNKIEEVQGK
jgi:hypothetical protein